VRPHIHLYIVGHKAATVAREFVERQNKIYHKKYPDNCHIDYGAADPGSFELNKAKTLYMIQIYRTPVN